MKKFNLLFIFLLLVTFFASSPSVSALDYEMPIKWAGYSPGDAFSIQSQGRYSGNLYYKTNASSHTDYLVVSYCSNYDITTYTLNHDEIQRDPYHINTKEWCTTGTVAGTIQYDYYAVNIWTYTEDGQFVYLDFGNSFFYNKYNSSAQVLFYGIQSSSSLDVSVAILAYLESQKQDIDYSDALSQIQQNTNSFNEEIGIVQDELTETNGNLEDIKDAFNSESEDFEDSSCGVICKLGKIPQKIIDGIINALKSLFIPEDGYFEQWFNDLKTFFEEKLGILAMPFTLFIDFINLYVSLDSSKDIIINIPDITVPNFEDHIIISAQVFNWSELLKSKDSLNALWQLYLSFIDVYLILNFIGLCETKYNRIFGGDTSNYEYYTVEDSISYDNNTGEVKSTRHNERTTTKRKV